ncbi:MAG: TonB-dependent receptor [Phycisphaerae bacterium]|nr:TonB-dependent receptor [Phycisphaerae bacterium]
MTLSTRFLVAAAVAATAPWLCCAEGIASAAASVQQVGGLRGVVYDNDFDMPLGSATVLIVETGQRTTSTPEGNFVFPQVNAGTYTIIVSKDGYTRLVKSGIVVASGQMAEMDTRLDGTFEEMEEFVVQDIQVGGGEAALLKLRLDSASMVDSISSELMRKAAAGDAAQALKLVAGATVQDGKYAVVRGLPDRYVNSQLNGMRLPTADEDKRAVQLDQFPTNVIDSIVVSKTFTPDQQGDASGGAVNVRLKGVPTETSIQFSSQVGFNTQAGRRSDFLTYRDGGLPMWADSGASKGIQYDNLGQNWTGAAGVSRDDAPIDHKWSLAAGISEDLGDDVRVGGFLNFYYERDSAFHDNGIDDSYWVTTPGAPMTPETTQGTPSSGEFKTKLFDVTKGSQTVTWGGLGTLGIESELHKVSLSYLGTRTAEDTAILAEDTRGKAYYFPNYDPYDITSPGNSIANRNAAPYLRTETLEYTERSTRTFQLRGSHKLALDEFELEEGMMFGSPEVDWTISTSQADLYQPDKRQFGALWLPESLNPGFPPFIPPFSVPGGWVPYKPAENFTLGNFQRIWKDIHESAQDYAINLKVPFKQWTDNEGYFKFGVFNDATKRRFNQDTFSNFNDNDAEFAGDFSEYWSAAFPNEPGHEITDGPPFVDVDYSGRQEINAVFGMVDLPLTEYLSVIGGARYETTDLSIVNSPEVNAIWFPPGSSAPVALSPGDADVFFSQEDLLPSFSVLIKPLENVTLRSSYSETVARQTYKELTPIQQQEFLGGEVFIGNPALRMSALQNYDLRLDWNPGDGSLVSVSWFYKEVDAPIEYVQRPGTFTFTTPVNYPKGELSGWEFEVRQNLGTFMEELDGLAVGMNATLISSKVLLPEEDIAELSLPNINAPMTSRDMTGAPSYLANAYITYELSDYGTELGLFYTLQGDTLVAGAGSSPPNFVPSVYSTEYGTLNLSISQKLGEWFKLQFQAKNLTDPRIEEVYRSQYIGADVLKTSYTKGIDLSISLSCTITF